MANNTVKLGLVGLGGHMTDNLLLRLMSLPVEITAVCDIKEDRHAMVGRKFKFASSHTDYRTMLEDEELDAVICSVDPQIHYEVAKACMLSGRQVFVEKTPCHTVEQAEELAELQRSTRRYAMVGFNRRFATSYLMARDIAVRPEFGGVQMYQAKYHAGGYGSKDSFIFNHIVNHLDLARYLVGELTILHVEHFELDGRRFGYNLTFQGESGTIGNIQSASVQDMTFPVERVELIGSGQNVIVDNMKNIEYNRPGLLNGGYEKAALAEQRDALIWNVNHGLHTAFTYLGYDLELSEFIGSVAEHRAPIVHMEDTLRTIRLTHQFHSLIK